MDWKYKHFHQERVFPASRDLVSEATRTFMAESLGWQVTNTTEGFTGQGYSFSHRAVANLRIQSAAGGIKVAVELLVERAGWRGFMLFDVVLFGGCNRDLTVAAITSRRFAPVYPVAMLLTLTLSYPDSSGY